MLYFKYFITFYVFVVFWGARKWAMVFLVLHVYFKQFVFILMLF
jgi:hypothetical protein